MGISLLLYPAVVILIIGLFFWYLQNAYKRRNLESENTNLRLRLDLLRRYVDQVEHRLALRIPVDGSTFVQQYPQGIPGNTSTVDLDEMRLNDASEVTGNGPVSEYQMDAEPYMVGNGYLNEIAEGERSRINQDSSGHVPDENVIDLTGNMTVTNHVKENEQQPSTIVAFDKSANEQLTSDGVYAEQGKDYPVRRLKMGELQRANMPDFDFLRKIRYAGNRSQNEVIESDVEVADTEEAFLMPPDSSVQTTYVNTVADDPDSIVESSADPEKEYGIESSSKPTGDLENHQEIVSSDESLEQLYANEEELRAYPWTPGSHIVRLRVVEQYDGVTECIIFGYSSKTFLQHPDLDKLDIGDFAAVHVSTSKSGMREVIKVWPLTQEEFTCFDEEMLEQAGG